MKSKSIKRRIIWSITMVLFVIGALSSCEKDDDMDYLTSFKYTPNSKTVSKSTAFTGTNAVISPTAAKVKFAIKSVKKGSSAFTNPTKGIKIDNNTGKLSLGSDNTLEKASYEITVEGSDQNNTKIKKTATYTIKIE